MAQIYNPNSKSLIVLSVKIRTTQETIDFLFPLNPASLTTNQASRVSATFTYGAKVFQNLGAGLKTLSFEGHTGYKLDPTRYGLQVSPSSLAVATAPGLSAPGKAMWLDLYSLIQLIKGENKFLSGFKVSPISEDFSVDNIDNIETVKITIPDQGITYDVLLQNDSFMRNREQPHLYKYKLDFIIVQESFGVPKTVADVSQIPDVGSLVNSLKAQANLLSSIKSSFMALPGVQAISSAYDTAVIAINKSVQAGNFFLTAANSSINDLRRLERMSDALQGVANNISTVRGVILEMKTFTDLQTAFYEPIIRLKNILSAQRLLKKAMTGEQQNLSFNVSLSRLASISAPVTLAANKATVAQFEKDIRKLSSVAFPFPVDYVKEITSDGIKKISISFKARPSSLGISGLKVYAVNDFGNETDLVESFTDTSAVLSTNYDESGFFYNFVIEYNYTTFESIVQSRYKSIKRILITPGETFESIIKKYAAAESTASKTYQAEVAYLNGIEYPYVVTSDNVNYDAYFGSYGFKIFTTNGEFCDYIYNIDREAFPGPDLPLYTYADVEDVFLLQQPEVIAQIQTASKFFVLLFKETYSNRCYALFGMTNSPTCKLFSADSYAICALEKGRSYDIDNNIMFEVLSPYSVPSDLIDYYGQTVLFDSIVDPTIDLYNKNLTVINAIYEQNIGTFTSGDFPFTTSYDDEVFLAGDIDNKNYVILTNFTSASTGVISAYTVSAFSTYRVLTNGQEILLPSFSKEFLSFTDAYSKEDTYKVDLDSRFQYFDDINVSILPRTDLGVGQGILDFKLIDGLDNVKQAIKNRLECPAGGLILHMDYGLPNLLGKKNTLENMILLRYSLFSQLTSDARVKSASNIQIADNGDALKAEAAIVLVNNDETIITKTV